LNKSIYFSEENDCMVNLNTDVSYYQ